MSSLVFLVPLALVLGGAALAAFLWTLRSGQYDDLDGAAERILLDDKDDHAGAGSLEAVEEVNRPARASGRGGA